MYISEGIPDSVLEQCPEADRMLCENVLMVAQAEIEVLNLASTVFAVNGSTITMTSTVQGQEASVSFSQLRSIQADSPARVRDTTVGIHGNTLVHNIVIADSPSRVTASDTAIIRVVRKRRLW